MRAETLNGYGALKLVDLSIIGITTLLTTGANLFAGYMDAYSRRDSTEPC
jgi:hypothetical protein